MISTHCKIPRKIDILHGLACMHEKGTHACMRMGRMHAREGDACMHEKGTASFFDNHSCDELPACLGVFTLRYLGRECSRSGISEGSDHTLVSEKGVFTLWYLGRECSRSGIWRGSVHALVSGKGVITLWYLGRE